MQANKYPIKYWAKAERPREKLLSSGAQALSEAELLAILINHGTRERSALDLAQELLGLARGNLAELCRLPTSELLKIRGIGPAKAITISAALELGRRRQLASRPSRYSIKNSSEVKDYLRNSLQDLQQEVFAVIFLNQANFITHFEIVSQGGITGTVADPRVILKKALELGAVSLILCHNHPSGSLVPSAADENLTSRIAYAAKYLDIRVLDHIIVSEQGVYSFADAGLL